jgi:hypothetical protein
VLLGIATAGAGLAGCSDPVTIPPPTITVAALPASTGQTAFAGSTLPKPLTVQVAADGTPLSGVTVNWRAMAGAVGRTTSVTGTDGVTTSAWTLGVDTGVQTATATVTEAQGSPVTFSARALALPSEPTDTGTPWPPPDPTGVGQVLVSPDVWQVRPGESYRLRAFNDFQSPLPNAAVSWASQQPDIATVSATGLVTGVAPGSTTITARSDGAIGAATITVLGRIVSVELVATPAAIAVGEEVFWDLEARDAVGTLMARWEATWRSHNPGIAFANVRGGITGVRPGTAEIAATVEGVTGKASLTVLAPLNLTGQWSMAEHFSSDGYYPCAASGPVTLDQGQSSALVEGTYHRAGICPQYQADSLDITGAVPLHGIVAGTSVSLESSAIYHCRYEGVATGDAVNQVTGNVFCSGLPGTAQEGWHYEGRFTLTK